MEEIEGVNVLFSVYWMSFVYSATFSLDFFVYEFLFLVYGFFEDLNFYSVDCSLCNRVRKFYMCVLKEKKGRKIERLQKGFCVYEED